MDAFAAEFPERYYECGIAESNMNHFRKGTHQGDVLHCLVGGAVLAEGDSGV